MPTLHWLTRDADLQAAGRVPYRLLEPVAEHAAGDPAAENMLIQGDNLAALKALLPFYAGRVKCIYIDPPYNTRSAFAHYDDNLEHSQWLAMIYPRLELLADLLAEDGSIWVSIDDNEGHYLKVVMDEVFGRGNFVTTVIWRKNYAPKSSARHFSEDHDYILVYARNGMTWTPNPMPRTNKQDKAYKNLDGDPRGYWKTSDLSARNPYSLGIYDVQCPSGRVINGPPKGRYWSVSKEKLLELDADSRIWWGKDGNSIPQLKRFLSEVKQGVVPQTLWSYEEVGHTQDAKKEIVTLFSEDVFGTPKPEALIKRVLEVATNPGDLVLDSFLGSGTTAAVAHKMGRRYIGIELGEHAVTHCVPRLRKVIAGEQGGISAAVGWGGGGGFRFYRLGEPVFDEQGRINPAIRFEHLAAHVWFAETRTPLTAPPTPPPSTSSGQALRGEESMPPPSLAGRGDGGVGPLLGIHRGVAYYLLYNGILGDRRPAGGNVLTRGVLAGLPPFAGPKVICGESCRLSPETLRAARVTFKQIPYDLKAR